MKDSGEPILRKQLIEFLTKGNAHITFTEAVKNLPIEMIGLKPAHLPYSIWQIVEHIRIAQRDILEFCTKHDYKASAWPDDYWPKEIAPEIEAAWHRSLQQINQDLNEFIALINDPGSDLYTPFAHGDGQNLLREAMLIADHTSYHTGEIIVIRRLLGERD